MSSGLPEGPPAQRGRTVPESQRPGLDTFSKPEDDTRFPIYDDGSIYEIRFQDGIGKEDQRVPDERDLSNLAPSYTTPGESVSPKTKAPYRDDVPNAKMARDLASRYLRSLDKNADL